LEGRARVERDELKLRLEEEVVQINTSFNWYAHLGAHALNACSWLDGEEQHG
jgi:hypothetical protein